MSLTDAHRATLVTLRSQQNSKFIEIAALLAQELGHGDVAKAGPKIRQDIADQAHAAIDRYAEEAELDRKEPATGDRPTAFELLLREHSELGAQISDVLDEAAGQNDSGELTA